MTLREAIEALEQFPADAPTSRSFTRPHSYRGDYESLAIERSSLPTTMGCHVMMLRDCVGSCFSGWKGGEFWMHDDTNVYIASVGSSDGAEPMTMESLLSWLL